MEIRTRQRTHTSLLGTVSTLVKPNKKPVAAHVTASGLYAAMGAVAALVGFCLLQGYHKGCRGSIADGNAQEILSNVADRHAISGEYPRGGHE
jgi:hypothetical protein